MPVPAPFLSRDTTALIALVGVRAIKAAVNGAAGPPRGRPGGQRVKSFVPTVRGDRVTVSAGRGQKVKTPADSASATQRLAYEVR
ncbi:hypothetical protein SAMN04489729_2769 [Amycolatopsis lurida]|nr:hypothetical protein SAMN04489729_2769 [Amycolatopsis lurida]